LPAIKAGAAKRNTCQKGKFHGITAITTPNGYVVLAGGQPAGI
jgi:hypothetical protein